MDKINTAPVAEPSNRDTVTAIGAAWLEQQKVVAAFRAALPGAIQNVPALVFDGNGFVFAGKRYTIADTFVTHPFGQTSPMTRLELSETTRDAPTAGGGLPARWVDGEGQVFLQCAATCAGGGHGVGLKPTGQTIPADAADVLLTLLAGVGW
jgi:hypothetical protein